MSLLTKIKRKIKNRFNPDSISRYTFKQGDIAIDCGANIGLVSEKLLEKGAIVYAFEPNPHAFKILQEKFKDNKNFHGINAGVSDSKDELKLFLHVDSEEDPVKWSTGSSFLEEKGNVDSDKYVNIPVIKLSDFINEPIDFPCILPPSMSRYSKRNIWGR